MCRLECIYNTWGDTTHAYTHIHDTSVLCKAREASRPSAGTDGIVAWFHAHVFTDFLQPKDMSSTTWTDITSANVRASQEKKKGGGVVHRSYCCKRPSKISNRKRNINLSLCVGNIWWEDTSWSENEEDKKIKHDRHDTQILS